MMSGVGDANVDKSNLIPGNWICCTCSVLIVIGGDN